MLVVGCVENEVDDLKMFETSILSLNSFLVYESPSEHSGAYKRLSLKTAGVWLVLVMFINSNPRLIV